MIKKNILFVFYAHVPYIPCRENISDLVAAPFYDLLSYSLLPFLRMCNRLDAEGVPFKCVLVISPLVCEMLFAATDILRISTVILHLRNRNLLKIFFRAKKN